MVNQKTENRDRHQVLAENMVSVPHFQKESLGSGIIKQRIPRAGQGRSGGYRLLIAYRTADLAVFLYGFAKSESDNIGDDELATLKEIAAGWFEADKKLIDRAIKEKYLQEVNCDEKR